MVAGASVLGAVSVSNPSVAGVASGLAGSVSRAGSTVAGAAVAGVADPTSAVTRETVEVGVDLAASSG